MKIKPPMRADGPAHRIGDTRPIFWGDNFEPSRSMGIGRGLIGEVTPVRTYDLAAAVGVSGPEQNPVGVNGNLEMFVSGFQHVVCQRFSVCHWY
jgi:hypothetical protein